MARAVELIDRSRWERDAVQDQQLMTRRKIVWVDQRLCEGHALCLQSAPEMFDLSDADQWDQAVAAVDACPRGAIALIEEPKGQPVR